MKRIIIRCADGYYGPQPHEMGNVEPCDGQYHSGLYRVQVPAWEVPMAGLLPCRVPRSLRTVHTASAGNGGRGEL